ncbi:MAG: DUF1566 domain-containing protein [Wenzhouxiangella sp.]|nr:DUF1566 domain-containing protein [Wenzhouxiangella sp.]
MIRHAFVICALLLGFLATHAPAQLYTKVSNSGQALPDNASLGDGPNDWACTRDKRTGLMWEVKRTSGLRAASHNYTWRSGNTGNIGNTTSCSNTLAPATCNTEALVNRYNQIGLCGSSNWRLPGGAYNVGSPAASPNGELAVFYQNLFATDGVSPGFWFPNTRLFWHWTSTLDTFNFGRVWLVNFDTAQVFSNFWDFAYPALLVTPDGPDEPAPPEEDEIFHDRFEEPVLTENFDDLNAAGDRGWMVAQRSDPEGPDGWFIGIPAAFPAHQGAADSYIAAGFGSTSDGGTISLWLLTPLVEFRAGSSLSFYTRTLSPTVFPDRLEIRACTSSPCLSIPLDAMATGDFQALLGTINPGLNTDNDPTGVQGYPGEWTQFNFGAEDGVPQSGTGRLAFRYFVPDGGSTGANGFYIGIDTVFVAATPAD